jgi:hypothetical protein
MEILTEDQYRALAFLQACNDQHYAPTDDEVTRWLDAPPMAWTSLSAASYMIGTLNRLGQGSVTELLVHLTWAYRVSSRLYIDELGRALLADAEQKVAEVAQSTTVVLGSDDPLAYATLMSELAAAGAGLLVDPWARREQVLHLIQDTRLSRLLVGSKLGQRDRDGISAMLGHLPKGRQLEVRISDNAHDRYLKAEDGAVAIIGSSMNTVASGASSTVVTPVPGDSLGLVAEMLESQWAAAAPLRPADAAAEPSREAEASEAD